MGGGTMGAIAIGFDGKFEGQLNFIVEIDKLKNILRKSKLFDGSRFENDAEHSWTVCVMALLLREYANFPVNIERAVSMLLIHDIVEADAGDTFLYAADRDEAHDREAKAAERIFGLLEDEQKEFFINLWQEYEEEQTNEAQFAVVFDRLEPLLQNYILEGYTWKKHGIRYDMVLEKNKKIKNGSETIWQFALQLLDRAVEKGYLQK
jgi:putative hydrolase of HD superfamily